MKKVKHAILTVGCSASGKSTWADEFMKNKFSWARIERDAIRRFMVVQKLKRDGVCSADDPLGIVETKNLWGEYNFKNMESETQERYDREITMAIDLGLNILVSDTNLNAKYRNQLIARLEAAGYDVELKMFHAEYKKLLERDSKRRDSVGQQVLVKQYFDFMDQFGAQYGFNKVVKVKAPDRECILVDIDGTLAHMNLNRSPYEWDKVEQDEVDRVVRHIVNSYYDSGVTVIVMSGRDAVCREQTKRWLNSNGIKHHRLYMRPEGDMRPDTDIKNEIIQNYINGEYNPIAWFDDRPCVVRLAHILGVKSIAMGNQHLEF